MAKNLIYVSPTGNDSNSGDITAPLLTLTAAQSAAKGINEPVTIYMDSGIYPAKDNTITLTAEDNIIGIKALEDAKPVINGGIRLDIQKAKRVTDSAILGKIINKKAKEMLYELDVADVINELPRPEYICGRSTPLLFAGDKPMQISRWPSKKYEDKATLENWLYTVHIEHGDPPRETPFDIKVDYAMTEHMKLFWDEKAVQNAWLAGYLWHNWSFSAYKVQSFDPNMNSVTALPGGRLSYLCDPEPCYKYRRFFFYNILEEISEPLEYYIDFEAHKLYVCLESLDTDIYIAVPQKPFITLDKASGVTIEGICLMYSTNKLLKVKASDSITVQGCTLSCCTDDAAEFESTTKLNVLDNHIYNAGSGGMIIHNCGNMKELKSAEVLIEGNDIHDVALKKQNMSCAINIWDNIGVTIRQNKLHNSQHTLLYIFSGLDTVIEYNEIYDAALDTDDAAAVYWGRTACILGTKIRCNYFHDIGQNNSGTWCIGAIYTDDLATSAEIYGNVFKNAAIFGDDNSYKQTTHNNPTVMLNNAQFVNVHDNIMIMSTRREMPITNDMGKGSTAEWLMCSLGAYIPGNFESHDRQMQWREQLKELGFFEDDGITPNRKWEEHFKGSAWEDVFKLLSRENYLAGATDENGNTYGIPDVIERFNKGEITVQESRSIFKAYCEGILKKLGDEYTPNVFRNNIIVGMNPEFLNENGSFIPKHINASDNTYISVKEAKKMFYDYDGLDFTFKP